jgi:hypothetical protein
LEPRLEVTEVGVDAAIDFRSAASKVLDRATDLRGLDKLDGVDCVFVKLRVKYVCCSSISHIVIIILAYIWYSDSLAL